METRKVQVTGGSTFTVSIPKDWAERNGLSRGETLFMEEDGNTLTVSCSDSKEKRKIEFDGDGGGERLERHVIAAYVDGYSVMRIGCSGRDKEAAKGSVSKLMGTEIIEEGADHIVVEDLLDPFQLDPDRGLKRMHLMARDMHHDAIRSFRCDGMAADVAKRDDEVDRLYLLISRQFSLLEERGGDGHFDTLMCARALERIADHACKVAGNASSCDASRKVRDELAGLSEDMIDLVDSAVTAFHTGSRDGADGVFDRRASLQKGEIRVQKMVLSEPTEAAVREHTILDSIGRSADYSTDIAEAAFNSSLP